MAKSTALRKPKESVQAPVERRETAGASLAERLARARTANEMTSIIGLKPIKGRSGPKLAY